MCVPDTSATEFSIYPFPSAFHSMTVFQVASQIFISVITCCLWYMHPSYDVHTQGTWTLSKILFHGWHLATWWKIFTKFKIEQVLFLRNFSVTRFQKKKKSTRFLCHVAIDSKQYRRMLTFFYFHMVHL
jgi:hypothetical protein